MLPALYCSLSTLHSPMWPEDSFSLSCQAHSCSPSFCFSASCPGLLQQIWRLRTGAALRENAAAAYCLPLVVLYSQMVFTCKRCINKIVEDWAAGYLLVFHVLLKSCGFTFLSLLSQDRKVEAWRGEAAAASCCCASEEIASALCSYHPTDILLFLLLELVLGTPLTEVYTVLYCLFEGYPLDRHQILNEMEPNTWILAAWGQGFLCEKKSNRSVFFCAWSKDEVYAISSACIPICLQKVRWFWLFLKVKQGNMGKHKAFSLTSVWDKAMEQLKWAPFTE